MKVLRCAESFQYRGNNGFVVGETSSADHATGEISRARFDDFHTTLAKDLEVRLSRGIVPHVHVHRRRDDDGRSGREEECCEEVARNSLREMRDDVGSGGSNQERIDGLRDGDVFDRRIDIGFVLFAGGEHAGDDFFSGKGGEGEGPDEFLGGAGHDDLHADTAILQQANDLGCFIGCDSTGNAEGDLHGIFDC